MKFFSLIISAAVLTVAFISCSKAVVEPQVSVSMTVKNTIAYIYKTDSTEAVIFKNLLQLNGCAVTLLDRNVMTGFDFSKFNMIVVDNNTNGTTLATQWTSAESATIKNSGKPVLLVGIGGMYLAKKLDNKINEASCGSNSISTINIPNPECPVLKSPKKISLAPGSQLQLYSSTVTTLGFFTISQPADIVLIANQAGGLEYYPVAYEGSRYCLFGFYNGMDKLTPQGKDFLVNLVYYAGKLNL